MAGLTMRATAALLIALFATTSVLAQSMGPLPGPNLLQGPPPVSAVPKDATREPEDQMRAKRLKDCKAGDRVLASHDGHWISAQVIAVDAAAPYPCKVHLIGRPPLSDGSFAAWMLRPESPNP